MKVRINWLLSIGAAGCIFGKGAGASSMKLYKIPNDIRQKGVPFDFQNDRSVSCGNGDASRIQEISAP